MTRADLEAEKSYYWQERAKVRREIRTIEEAREKDLRPLRKRERKLTAALKEASQELEAWKER